MAFMAPTQVPVGIVRVGDKDQPGLLVHGVAGHGVEVVRALLHRDHDRMLPLTACTAIRYMMNACSESTALPSSTQVRASQDLDDFRGAVAENDLIRSHAVVLGQGLAEVESGTIRIAMGSCPARYAPLSQPSERDRNGFSFEASLMVPDNPSSRSTSSTGLPGS